MSGFLAIEAVIFDSVNEPCSSAKSDLNPLELESVSERLGNSGCVVLRPSSTFVSLQLQFMKEQSCSEDLDGMSRT
jgi:hypothetical protein